MQREETRLGAGDGTEAVLEAVEDVDVDVDVRADMFGVVDGSER